MYGARSGSKKIKIVHYSELYTTNRVSFRCGKGKSTDLTAFDKYTCMNFDN